MHLRIVYRGQMCVAPAEIVDDVDASVDQGGTRLLEEVVSLNSLIVRN